MVAASLAGAAPAGAAGTTHPQMQTTSTMLGSLTVAWTGDPARGCATVGVCGVSGTLQVTSDGGLTTGGGPPGLELSDGAATVRVIDRAPDGSVVSTCADMAPVDIAFAVRHTAQGLTAAAGGSGGSLSAGRCAGPVSGDLGAIALPARRAGAHGYSLGGRVTVGAGPFTVTLVSTLRAVVIVSRSGQCVSNQFFTSCSTGGSAPIPGRARTVLQEHATYTYRITGLSGTLTQTFTGRPDPLCRPLGACGTAGSVAETISGTGLVHFTGARTVAHRVGAARALADLRAGRLGIGDDFGSVPVRMSTSEHVSGPGTATCADTQTGLFAGGASRARGRTGDQLTIVPSGDIFGNGGPDVLRTHCPGPSTSEVLGGAPGLVQGTIPTRRLGARRLTVTLTGTGAFTRDGYAGARQGSVTLDLVRVRAAGGTSRSQWWFPGPGGGRP